VCCLVSARASLPCDVLLSDWHSLRKPVVSGSIAQVSLTENAASPVPLGLGIFSPRAQHNASSPSRSNRSESYSGVRLPKINLQKFNGDVTRFNSFWQSFEFAVHNNTDVPKISKLYYLFSILEGAAYHAVEGLQLQEENYDHVVQILKSLFGKKQQIIPAHLQSLLKLQNSRNDCIDRLRTIYDSINVHIRGLESLGITAESYGSLLIQIIMAKMPRDITLRVARKTSEDIWDIDEILEIIRKELEANEISSKIIATERRAERSTQQRPKSPQGTTSSFFSTAKSRNKVECYFCQGEHFSFNCNKVIDVKERKHLLSKAKRCFNCLRVGHISKECRSPRGCLKCKGRHHQSICNTPESSGLSDARMANPCTSSKAQSETKAESTTATATKRQDGKILLQTATAHVYSRNADEKIQVKLLFDNGSQRTYITEDLKKRLSLEVEGSENLNLNTFGSEQGKKMKCDRVSFKIALDNDSEVEISALTHPTICSPLGSSIDLRLYPHLQGLQLADRSTNSKERIDVLIGADF